MEREKGTGITLGDDQRHCISNLRLAGDVLLLSNSLDQLKKMMTDFKRSTEKLGLQIHPDKTKIL